MPFNFSLTTPSSSGLVMTMYSGGIADIDFYGIKWGTNSTPKSLSDFSHILRLKTDGSVGIGTKNTLGYKLAVNGTIGAKEIKVEIASAWPDYVFSDDYNLMPINEVEDYIKKNKHLPEIPQADEVKDGIALGEMNTKLLQKIEELTLYIIDLQKQVDNLKSRLNNQR